MCRKKAAIYAFLEGLDSILSSYSVPSTKVPSVLFISAVIKQYFSWLLLGHFQDNENELLYDLS